MFWVHAVNALQQALQVLLDIVIHRVPPSRSKSCDFASTLVDSQQRTSDSGQWTDWSQGEGDAQRERSVAALGPDELDKLLDCTVQPVVVTERNPRAMDPKEASERERSKMRLDGIDHLRRWLGLRIYGIYARPLAPPPNSEPDIPQFSHRVFDARDVEALLALAKRPDLEMSETFVRRALAKGDACGVVLYKDQIVSYAWFAFTPTHDSEDVYVDFGDNDRYGYKALTLEEFRGQHLFRYYNRFSDAHCIARGRTHSIAFVDVSNHASIRAIDRVSGIAGSVLRDI